MSGFVVAVNRDGAPIDPALMGRMTDALIFRGPDAQDIWLGQSVGLGHALFQTKEDTTHERQPCSLDGEVWITGDVRVDQRAEFVRALEEAGRLPPKTATDPELILHAYQAWGEKLVDRLLGDFSFAIWDGVNGRLFCARDQLGVKPFYYAFLERQLIVSNTLSCLKAHGEIPNKLNDMAVGDFLLFGFNTVPETTIFASIQCLPAGHTLIWSPGRQPTLVRYWTMPVYEELRLPKPGDYVEYFQSLFEAAITDRLRTSCVGVQMSGGLDSSLIAGTAHRLLSQRGRPFQVHAHTVVYDDLFSDPERHFSTLVAGHLNIPINHLVADDFRLLDARTGQCDKFPEPRESHSRPQLLDSLNQQIANTSRVALTGWDGDALLSSSWQTHLAKLLRGLEFGTLAADSVRFARAKQNLRGAFASRLRWPERDIGSVRYPTWLNPAFEQRLELSKRWKKLHAKKLRAQTSFGVGSRESARDIMAHPNWRPLLEGFDAGATGVPLEYRHPLLDLRVVGCALSLPAIPWCVDKQILRASGQKVLPEAILKRPKTALQGDPVPIAIRHYVARSLEPYALHPNLKQYVDATQTSDLIDDVRSLHYSAALRVLILNQWLSTQ